MKLDLEILMKNTHNLNTLHSTNNDQSPDLTISNSSTTMTYTQRLIRVYSLYTANINPNIAYPIHIKIPPIFTATLEIIHKTNLKRIYVKKCISDI